MHRSGNYPRPPGLMASPQARPIVPMEVLVELDAIFPVRIFLELFLASIHRPPPVLVCQENTAQPPRDFLGHLIKVHLPTGPGRTLNNKIIPVISVVLQERPNYQCVNGHPYRPSPV